MEIKLFLFHFVLFFNESLNTLKETRESKQ